MVGAVGLEPTTSGLQSRHSTQTELHPDKKHMKCEKIKITSICI